MLWQTNKIKHRRLLQRHHLPHRVVKAVPRAEDTAVMVVPAAIAAAVAVVKVVPAAVAARAAKVDPAAAQADLAAASANFSVRKKSANSVSQNSAPPHDWRLRASPALAWRGHQARSQHRVAAVCWQRCRQLCASRGRSREAAASSASGATSHAANTSAACGVNFCPAVFWPAVTERIKA